jgi:hypothetical protein
MVVAKDFKRLVRARMEKTGESYTAARAQLQKLGNRKSEIGNRSGHSAPPDYAALAGMKDEAVLAKTRRTWSEWVRELDRIGAAQLSHAQVARMLSEKYDVPPWWTQMVTVGYERIKGKRSMGQRSDGKFGADRSRTFAVPVERLFNAFAVSRTRNRWLTVPGMTLRSSSKPKVARFAMDDGTRVVVGFTSKGASKSSVAIQHEKLPSREAATRMKQVWGEQLDALGAVLEAPGRKPRKS